MNSHSLGWLQPLRPSPRKSAMARLNRNSRKAWRFLRQLHFESLESRELLSASMAAGPWTEGIASTMTASAFVAATNQYDRISLASVSSGVTTSRPSLFAFVAPAAPSFHATAASGTQVNLSWNTVPGASGYLVDIWIHGAWVQLGNLGSSATGCSVVGLSPGTTYYFDVGAYNAAGVSWANYQSATTATTLSPPAAPTFTATTASSTQVNLSWNAVSGASGYLVDERINNAWVQIGNYGSGTTGTRLPG